MNNYPFNFKQIRLKNFFVNISSDVLTKPKNYAIIYIYKVKGELYYVNRQKKCKEN